MIPERILIRIVFYSIVLSLCLFVNEYVPLSLDMLLIIAIAGGAIVPILSESVCVSIFKLNL